MKILFWTPIYWPDIGGIEIISRRLIQGLTARGHEIVVFTAQGRVEAPDESDLDGTMVYRFPIVSALQNHDLRQLLSIQKKIVDIKTGFNPDIEHLNFGGPVPISYLYLRTASIGQAPLIVTLRVSISDLDGSDQTITGKVLRAAHWTTGVSSAILEDARHTVPDIRERSSVVYNGLWDVDIQPTSLPFKDVTILCMGRLVPEKGVDLVIEAFSYLAKSYPNARLVVAGDGPLRQNLEQQAQDLNISFRVDFIGAYEPENVYGLINQATLVVVPSRYREAFGQVAVEASQMARPVIASRVGGLEEAVLDGETGILVEMENSQAIAHAIGWMLENPEASIRMGQSGFRRARTVFSWEQFVNAFEAIYFQIRRTGDGK